MYAIVNISGVQYKVKPQQSLLSPKLNKAKGEYVDLNEVKLFVNEDGTTLIGTPNLDNVKIKAVVLGEVKGEKIYVFKKKRRKGYTKKTGHRQKYTQLKIEEITVD